MLSGPAKSRVPKGVAEQLRVGERWMVLLSGSIPTCSTRTPFKQASEFHFFKDR